MWESCCLPQQFCLKRRGITSCPTASLHCVGTEKQPCKLILYREQWISTNTLNFTAEMCVPEPGPNVVISKRDCVYVCLCFGLMARYSSVSLELLSKDVSELSHNRSNSSKIKEREETRKTKSLLLVHLLDFPASCSLDSMTVHQWLHRCMVILCVLTAYMWAFNFPSDTRWLMMARQGSLKVLLLTIPLNVSSSDLALYLKEIPSGNQFHSMQIWQSVKITDVTGPNFILHFTWSSFLDCSRIIVYLSSTADQK